MSDRLVDLLERAAVRDDGRVFGVVTGIVTSNGDPEGLGRVKVKFPWLADDHESWWARVAAPMAAAQLGTFFLPAVNDEVLVAFEHGDMRFPYVVGSLWNANAKPPEAKEDQPHVQTIKSRSGHTIRLDDSDGAEQIAIVDKSGKDSVVFDAAKNTITIAADADIEITSSSGKLTLSGNGVEITSQAGVKITASANLDLTADGQTNVKGSVVNLN
jgi:uncharacterized protein involved in type VI secretion and phage assembly